MIERLQRALAHVDELSPETQEKIAQLIEDRLNPHKDVPEQEPLFVDENPPKSVRDALASAGTGSDMEGDEFEALDRIRRERDAPSPVHEQPDVLDER